MTTILAVAKEGKVVMACDSKVTDGTGESWSHPSARKIRDLGEVLIGGSGEVAALDIALHIWQPPKSTITDRKDLYHFVISKVIPSLKRCFKENDYKWQDEKGEQSDEPKFNFIIAVDGEIFSFSDDFGVVMRDTGILAIGSGASIALGALLGGAPILKAMEIAADQDDHTAEPFYTYEQKRKR